jgi:uncharacterized protein (DUF924 family)
VIHHSGANAETLLEAAKPASPLDWLSLVLLLDQIPRNVYRGEEVWIVFNIFDPIARGVARQAVEVGIPLSQPIRYKVAYRMWFVLPYMHSENMVMHDFALQLLNAMDTDLNGLIGGQQAAGNDDEIRRCRQVLKENQDSVRVSMADYHKFEMMHYDIIKQFGRYPHRNGPLRREPTDAETEFLEKGGATFGASAKK